MTKQLGAAFVAIGTGIRAIVQWMISYNCRDTGWLNNQLIANTIIQGQLVVIFMMFFIVVLITGVV